MSETKTKIIKNEDEWRKELTPMQYAVLREKATERPFSGEYEHEHREGTYVCAGCGQTLFESDAKFDFRLWLAELYRSRDRQSCRRGTRRQPRHDLHRGAVFEVRRPSRPRLQRRTGPNRSALLHQFGGLETRAQIVSQVCEASTPASIFKQPVARMSASDIRDGVRVVADIAALIRATHPRHCERSEAIHPCFAR